MRRNSFLWACILVRDSDLMFPRKIELVSGKWVMFSIATNPDSTVAQNWEGNVWFPTLRRNLNDWEIENMIAMIGNLQHSAINHRCNDKLIWGDNSEGIYSVKANYQLLSSIKAQIDQWPWKLIWKIILPP